MFFLDHQLVPLKVKLKMDNTVLCGFYPILMSHYGHCSHIGNMPVRFTKNIKCCLIRCSGTIIHWISVSYCFFIILWATALKLVSLIVSATYCPLVDIYFNSWSNFCSLNGVGVFVCMNWMNFRILPLSTWVKWSHVDAW